MATNANLLLAQTTEGKKTLIPEDQRRSFERKGYKVYDVAEVIYKSGKKVRYKAKKPKIEKKPSDVIYRKATPEKVIEVTRKGIVKVTYPKKPEAYKVIARKNNQLVKEVVASTLEEAQQIQGKLHGEGYGVSIAPTTIKKLAKEGWKGQTTREGVYLEKERNFRPEQNLRIDKKTENPFDKSKKIVSTPSGGKIVSKTEEKQEFYIRAEEFYPKVSSRTLPLIESRNRIVRPEWLKEIKQQTGATPTIEETPEGKIVKFETYPSLATQLEVTPYDVLVEKQKEKSERELAEQIYERSTPIEKLGLHVHTLFSGSWGKYLFSYPSSYLLKTETPKEVVVEQIQQMFPKNIEAKHKINIPIISDITMWRPEMKGRAGYIVKSMVEQPGTEIGSYFLLGSATRPLVGGLGRIVTSTEKGAKAVTKASSFLSKHPTLAKSIPWATLAGIETPLRYTQYKELKAAGYSDKDITEIIGGQITKDIFLTSAFSRGFETGFNVKRTFNVPTEYGELKVTPSGELKSFEPYVYVGKGERLVARGSVIKWGYGEVKPKFVEFKVPEQYISTRPPKIEPYNLKVYTKSEYLVGGSPTKTSTPFKSLEVEPLKIKTGEHVTLIKEPKTPGGTYAVQKQLPGITLEREIAGLPKSLQEDILKTRARNILVETARSEFYHQTLKGLEEFQSRIPGKKVFGKTFVLEVPTEPPKKAAPYLHVKPKNYLWQPGGKVPSGKMDWLKGKTEVSRPAETSSGLIETMVPEKEKIIPSSKPLVSIKDIKVKKILTGISKPRKTSPTIGIVGLNINKQESIISPKEKITISTKGLLKQGVEQGLEESIKQVQEQKTHFIIKTRHGTKIKEKGKQIQKEIQKITQRQGMLTRVKLKQKQILNMRLEKPISSEFTRFKPRLSPPRVLIKKQGKGESNVKKLRKLLSLPKIKIKRKKKEKYLPDIISASVSKFLFGKATPPKRITAKMKRHYYAGMPTRELMNKKVKARSVVSLKRLFVR